MVQKLKLIIKKIHWSLAVKSLFLAFSSLILPFWLFCFLALLIYFIPIFRPYSLFFQFLIFLLVARFFYGSFLGWLIIFVSFYLIVGIKDLIIIKRQLMYEFLGYLFFGILTFKFFENFGLGMDVISIFLGLFLSLFFVLFFKNEIFYGNKEIGIKLFKIGILVLGFFMWQLILILIFLPLTSHLQTAVLILTSILSFNFLLNYSFYELNNKFIIFNLLVFIILLSLILFSNHWAL